jgi:hypothetical protein
MTNLTSVPKSDDADELMEVIATEVANFLSL